MSFLSVSLSTQGVVESKGETTWREVCLGDASVIARVDAIVAVFQTITAERTADTVLLREFQLASVRFRG